MYTLVYSINNEPNPKTVYVNLTNACTNACVFCLREQKDDVCGAEMWHDGNYKLEDVIEQFEKFHTSKQIVKNVVFCGYGEPFLKKDMMKAFAQYLRKNYPEIKIRVNTNGHANAIYKTNVAEEFKGLLDEASVSLNSDNAEQYNEICQPKIENAYEAVKDFLKCCREVGIKTYASIVTGFDEREINVENCEKIANELGAEFRNREFITNGY
jgi:TatD family-associated radical SAM protein